MKITSNETFECYETAYESWPNNGKSITLDGQLLISIDKIKEARKEINNLNKYYDSDLYSDNTDPMFKCEDVLRILDSLIESEE